MTELIQKKADALKDLLILVRRELHRHPEKSGDEHKTKEILLKSLEGLGLEIKEGYYHTGFAVVIRGKNPGKTIGLRFDMDALEMDELIDVPYKSQNKGLMHACGHDGHMAMGIGCAMVLSEMREHFDGQVKLIFQPAEEDARSGGGAQFMIKDGVLLDEPKVDAMVGMHIWPDLKIGEVGSRVGPIMASSDPFMIKVLGKGGHASLPYKCVDPVVIASQIVLSMQSIVSRNVDPFEPAVVSIGILNAGTRYNTIPETAEIYGTVRTFDQGTREVIQNRLKTITEQTAQALGGSAELVLTSGYPPVMNEAQMVALAEASTQKILGQGAYVPIERPAPGGEDFAFFSLEVPSVFMWLGYNNEARDVAPPHSPYYDFDESILPIGVKTLCQLALDWLE